MTTDKEIMLKALQRERDELHERIMQVDRIIKRIKEIESVDNGEEIIPQAKIAPIVKDRQLPANPVQSSNMKIVVLNAMDILGTASKLKDIQSEVDKITGNKYPIRETLRALYRLKRVKMIKENGINRNCYWVKSEWIDNGQLIDNHKFDGFDTLYSPTDLTIE